MKMMERRRRVTVGILRRRRDMVRSARTTAFDQQSEWTSSTSSEESEQGIISPEPEKKEYSRYLPLYKAALRGDWASAERFFEQDEGALTAPIGEFSETVLYVAAVHGRNLNNFVKKLVEKMPSLAPDSVDKAYGNILNNAATVGNTEAVKALLSKYPSLVYFSHPITKWTPFAHAAANDKKDILLYLLEFTKNEPYSKLFPNENSAAFLIIELIAAGHYDIALYLVRKYPLLAISKRDYDGYSGLQVLATKASAFKSGTQYRWWQNIIYTYVPVKFVDCIISHNRGDIENPVDNSQVMGRNSYKYNWTRLLAEYICISVPCIKHIQKQKEMHVQAIELLKCFCEEITSLKDSVKYRLLAESALHIAAKNGIPEIVQEIVESFPTLLWTQKIDWQILFRTAIGERQEKVFNLIYQMGHSSREAISHMTDAGSKNSILHLAGKLAPPTKLSQISGAALKMQRELQWFEAVKKLMNANQEKLRNSSWKTPAMLFTEEHKTLVAEGEKWMKDKANSCTILAALIVTIVFVAAITVPSRINGTNGQPIFYKEMIFNIFAVFNAISLCTSTTSLLVFLSILTSRYAEHDFLFVLPNRLIIGLGTLFISITAMLIAFSSAIYLLFGNRAWILYPVAALACVPITSIVSLQYPLLRDLMVSTYGPGIFGKQSEDPFF